MKSTHSLVAAAHRSIWRFGIAVPFFLTGLAAIAPVDYKMYALVTLIIVIPLQIVHVFQEYKQPKLYDMGAGLSIALLSLGVICTLFWLIARTKDVPNGWIFLVIMWAIGLISYILRPRPTYST